jgi:hypothetical protein
MKKITLLLVIVLFLLTACATTLLPTNPTPLQKKAALCQDAQMGYNLSIVMLDTLLSKEANIYWLTYKTGASLAIQLYCGGN